MSNTKSPVSKARLLIVDDHEDLLGLLAFMLWREGYVVLTARSVSEAKELLQDYSVNLLIIDWQLPDGTGDHVCQAARRDYPNLPVIVMSGVSGKEADDIVKSKPDVYLRKPVERDTLVETIQWLLAEGRLGKEANSTL
jgi:DNA-binding response OmpR family regulator